MGKTTFILTDESVNSYGYRVLTSGGELEQFLKNPVMLYSHDGGMLPIGRWENLRVEGERLLAEAEFDMEDAFAAEVSRKVEKGIVKCCSIGFDIIEVSTDQALMLPGQALPTVTRWRLMECSICAIGANLGAMKLEAGQRMTLSRELTNQDKQTDINPIKQNNMDKNEQELAQVRQELADLRQQNETLTQECDQLRQAAKQARDNEIGGLLSAAVADGRITEASRTQWDKLMHADLENGKAALAALTPRASLSETLKEQGGKSEFAGKSWNELDRAGRLVAYKEQDPEGFRSLYKQTFGAEYVG